MKRRRYIGVSSQGRDGLPERLRNRESPHTEFTDASDPFGRIERQAMRKTESQRKGEQGHGSLMVKLDKPFPQLKPKNARSVIRTNFNRRWDQEIERARHEPQSAQMPARASDAFDAIDEAKQQRQIETYRGVRSPGLKR